MKLRTKINASFIIVFFIILVSIGGIQYYYTTQSVKDNALSYLQSTSRARAEHIRTFIQDQKKTSTILAAASVYRDFLKEATSSKQYASIKNKVNKRLLRTIESDNQIFEAFVLDRRGVIAASSDGSKEGLDRSDDQYFISSQKGVFFKDLYMSDAINKINYTVSAPILDDDGTFLGTSVLRYLPETFFSIVSHENGLGSTEENFLINKDKLLISPSRFLGSEEILKKKIDTQNTRDCFDSTEVKYVETNGYTGLIERFNQQIVEAKDYRGVDVMATHSYIPETGWCLVTKVDTADLLGSRTNLLTLYFLVLTLSGIIFTFVGFKVSNWITRPIQILKSGVAKIEKGDLNSKISLNTDDEINDLALAFDDMVTSLKESKSDIENKVSEQTKDLSLKTKELEDKQKSILNILEDVNKEKNRNQVLVEDLEKERSEFQKLLTRYGFATKSADIGVWEWDIIKNVLTWDDEMYKLYGIKKEDFGGAYDAWQHGLHPDDRKAGDEAIQMALKGEKDFNTKFRVVWPDGSIRVVRAHGLVERDKDGKPEKMTGVNWDITKEEIVDKEKTEFVSLASHQLKTPVGAISWNLEMLIDGDYGEVTPKQKAILADTYSLNKRMNELINALLNISRIEMGALIIEPVPTNIVDLCEEVVTEMNTRLSKKGHQLIKDFDQNLPQVAADPKLLRMVYQNYISNAIKYTKDKGKITVSLKKDIKNIVFSVANNGDPIPESDQPKIFSKLFRASNANDQDPDGTGLGLYVVKQIMENAGGRAWFTSRQGEDTVFYASFPVTGMIRKEGTKQLS